MPIASLAASTCTDQSNFMKQSAWTVTKLNREVTCHIHICPTGMYFHCMYLTEVYALKKILHVELQLVWIGYIGPQKDRLHKLPFKLKPYNS